MKTKNTMHISLIGLSRSEKNTLKVILPRRLKSDISFDAANKQPDLVLVCFDTQSAAEKWSEIRRKFPDAAAICLSINGTAPDNLPVVERPVKMDHLVNTINRVMQGVELDKPPSSNNLDASDVAVASKTEHIASDVKTFNPEQKLIGKMLRAKRLMESSNKDVLVKGLGSFLFTTDGQVFTNNSRHMLRSLCVPDLHPEAFSFKQIDSKEKQAHLNTNNNSHFFPLEPFLWDIARHCSRGALPAGLSDQDPLTLKRWPDCTRLNDPMLMSAISAVFARETISVRESARRHNLPAKTVAEYATAGYLLSSMEAGDQRTGANRQHKGRWSTSVLSSLARRLAGRVFGKTA